jgi:ATP-binding cassette subfamily B protein/subfamily B ATP-binding cassette protein MsbA
MKNFSRAVRLALKRRFTVLGVLITSLLVALFWGANVGAVYPFMEVVFQGDSMHEWVRKQIENTEENLVKVQAKLDDLKRQAAAARSADERARLERQIRFQQSRLVAERKAQALARKLQPLILRYLPDDPFRTLLLVVAFVLAGTLARNISLIANMVLVGRLSQLATLDLRREFYRRTLQMDLSTFGRGGTGGLMSRFTGDVGAINSGLGILFGKSLREPLKMLVCMAGAAWVSWRLLVLSLIVTPMALLLMYLLGKSIKRASRRSMEEMAKFFNRLAESFSGIHVVAAFTMERFERNRFHKRAKELYRRSMRLVWYGSLARMNNELLGVGVICLAIMAGGYLVLTQDTQLLGVKMTDRPLSFGALMVFYACLAGVSDPARKLADVYSNLQSAAAAADRVYALLDREPSISDPPHPVPLPAGRRDLTFEHVHFQYTPGNPVLRDINFCVRHGETLAIVGPNGCGKTTLVNMAPRFYDPAEGVVRLGGVDLRDLRLRELRQQIGVVTQHTVLFEGTIRDNIRYGSLHATDKQVMEAAKKAHVHRFVESLDEGYHTNVGERGGRLSGGQRQRISLARAILRDPAILILDEATSHIDPESEQMIQGALESFIRGRTTLLITHRMSALDLADRILVLDGGAIADIGTHDQLINRCPLYGRLYQVDFRQSA